MTRNGRKLLCSQGWGTLPASVHVGMCGPGSLSGAACQLQSCALMPGQTCQLHLMGTPAWCSPWCPAPTAGGASMTRQQSGTSPAAATLWQSPVGCWPGRGGERMSADSAGAVPQSGLDWQHARSATSTALRQSRLWPQPGANGLHAGQVRPTQAAGSRACTGCVHNYADMCSVAVRLRAAGHGCALQQ